MSRKSDRMTQSTERNRYVHPSFPGSDSIVGPQKPRDVILVMVNRRVNTWDYEL